MGSTKSRSRSKSKSNPSKSRSRSKSKSDLSKSRSRSRSNKSRSSLLKRSQRKVKIPSRKVDPEVYEAFTLISSSKSDYLVYKLDKTSHVFEDFEFMRVILQQHLDVTNTNQLLREKDIYMRMYRLKMMEFMRAHKVYNEFFDLCRGQVGNVPAWISKYIFSLDPIGQDVSLDTVYTHDYVFYVEKSSKELKGILVYELKEDLKQGETLYDMIQIKLLCTNKYTDKLGTRIMKGLKMFGGKNDVLIAHIIEPTRNAIPFYQKMGFGYKGKRKQLIKRLK